jgi:antitoxin VapB
MAGLTIESPEAERLATAIATQTGKSVDDVVTESLREQFERLPKKRERKASVEELLAMAHEIASLAKGPSIDHGELLYDEHGLPK